jgi:hypothetical protein
MSSELEGQSSDLSLTVEASGTAGIDGRVIARLDVLDFLNEIVDLPFELWAGLVIYPKPAVGRLPHAFSERQRQDDLLAALDQSGAADILYVESTMSPPKSGKEGKKWPSIVVFAFFDANKFARIHETFKTAFLSPGSTYALEIENIQLKAIAGASARIPFRDWRMAGRPIIAAGRVEISIKNANGGLARLITLVRVLVILVTVELMAILLHWMR